MKSLDLDQIILNEEKKQNESNSMNLPESDMRSDQ